MESVTCHKFHVLLTIVFSQVVQLLLTTGKIVFFDQRHVPRINTHSFPFSVYVNCSYFVAVETSGV